MRFVLDRVAEWWKIADDFVMRFSQAGFLVLLGVFLMPCLALKAQSIERGAGGTDPPPPSHSYSSLLRYSVHGESRDEETR